MPLFIEFHKGLEKQLPDWAIETLQAEYEDYLNRHWVEDGILNVKCGK